MGYNHTKIDEINNNRIITVFQTVVNYNIFIIIIFNLIKFTFRY